MRRRSVDDLLAEIKEVAQHYPVARFVRFADDVFVVNKEDEWLEEFAERYPKEIGLPFYCLIRCNALTENVARLLKKAGCKSFSMSIEAGSERVRNDIMKRNMPDAMVRHAFALARKYGINAWGNSIASWRPLARHSPMTSKSFYYARSLNAAAPALPAFLRPSRNRSHQAGGRTRVARCGFRLQLGVVLGLFHPERLYQPGTADADESGLSWHVVL